MRKYCNICKKKVRTRFFNQHQIICKQKHNGEQVLTPCNHCQKIHDTSYGSGIFCSKNCSMLGRTKQTCTSCDRQISSCNYNSHIKSCKGKKLNINQWKIGDDKYQCPSCEKIFPRMGIASHYVKIHGKITSNLIDGSVSILNEKKPRHKNCQICGDKLHGKQRSFCSTKCKFKSPKIKANCYSLQKERGIKRKILLIQNKGGKCENCGYNKNLAALCFHHKDPSTKSFQLDARRLSNNNIDFLKIEADKCRLLCHNCHMEHHYPTLQNLLD